ncbi:MAG: formate/nitrite transporter family protein, partial [Anaerolineaceae bacterium]|nr:formate/nitrite transporter family protein [Anaerolineaceae bacterium]
AVKKAALPFLNLLPLSFLGGTYIAFGAVFASVVATGMPDVWPYGIIKLLQGLAFSMGLILVVIGGGELFTGNMLMVIALAQKKIGLLRLIHNWLIVYIGNFIGSVAVVLMIIFSKSYLASKGALGNLMVVTAIAKVQYGFSEALMLGIMCNIMVCLAIWLTYSGRTTTDKILAIIFPITFFIAAGFEHSVANMFIIPMGLLLKTFDPLFVSSLTLDLTQLTWPSFILRNLLPVTLGNIIGGSLFVGILYLWSYRKNKNVS